MLGRLIRRWAKSPTFSTNEMRVLRELLPECNRYSRSLLSQAEQAPYVSRRLIDNAGFEAIIPYVNDDSLLIECESNLKSPKLEVVDSKSGRRLCFFTEVLRGGFLRGLSGCAMDGNRWPKDWDADFGTLRVPTSMDSWLDAIRVLPEPSGVIAQLAEWCDISVNDVSPEQRAALHFAAPADDIEIQHCEARLGLKLNEKYKKMLKIANGFSVKRRRPYEILGASDLDFIGDSREWIGVTPLYEDGFVAMKVEDELATARCFLLSPDGTTNEIGDCGKHIRDSLLWNVQ